ncbi:MAG: pseudouridine synthase [Terracidiphilus sp.]|jgi:23S rRNA pseudouridine2605 synthase
MTTKKKSAAPADSKPESNPESIEIKTAKPKAKTLRAVKAASPELTMEPAREPAKEPAKKPAKKAAKKSDAEGGEGFNPRKKTTKSAEALAPEPVTPASPVSQLSSAASGAEQEEIQATAAQDAIDSEIEKADSEQEPFQSAGSATDQPDAAEAEDQAGFEADDDTEPEFTPQPRPPAKLERLQKILAAAGVASRRSAETMIEQGRVQINGKTVTVLGTKADAGRDHIRVDGKLLQGPERLRYFVLNKPKGFVTTVKDPEGRPTVMQFFDKMKERLYPVGRLDYMSEGLLVVTNDGDLANRLTKASSGVEKTYLVKVAGQPTEDELNVLRGGVTIELGKPGSRQVRTSPARIRQVRQGDNPWYEVILIEGRNRELRKMFEEIGHFVEKIRRTGYGPLVLDQEPGNLRELEPRELEALRQAAEGKLRTPKSKDVRRRNLLDAGILPTVLPKPSSRPRQPIQPPARPFDSAQKTDGSAVPALPRPARKEWGSKTDSRDRVKKDFAPKKFGAKKFEPKKLDAGRPSPTAAPYGKGGSGTSFRPERGPVRGGAESFRPEAGRTSAPNPVRSFSHSEDERPSRPGGGGQATFGSARPSGRSFDRPAYDRPGSDRPSFDRQAYDRPNAGSSSRPSSAGTGGTAPGRPFTAKPAWKKPDAPGRSERPAHPGQSARSQRPERPRPDQPNSARPRPDRPVFKRPAPPVRPLRDFEDDLGPVRPPNLHIEEVTGPDRSSLGPSPSRPFPARSNFSRPPADRSSAPRSYSDRPASTGRSGPAKPFRSEGGLARPYSTSSGQPRVGGARPSSKPGAWKSRPSADRSSSVGRKPAGRSFAPGSGPRPASGSQSIDARTGSGYRPSAAPRAYKPRTEGASDYRPTSAKPYPGSSSRAERKAGPGWKPKSGGFSKSGAPADRSSSVGWKSGAPADRSSSVGWKSGYKGKPSGGSSFKRSGPRPGGKPGGKKRG